MKDIPIIINGLNVNEAQARIQELEGLVREMGGLILRCHGIIPEQLWKEILDRPEVKAALEKKPCPE